MEYEIYDALAEHFDNIKIDVEYKDVRKYKIKLQIETMQTEFIYTYDAHLTFDANISIIIKEIEKCIIKYYQR